MTRKDYIEIEVKVGYDPTYTEESESGLMHGRELIETVRMPIEDAVAIVQNRVDKLDYYAAREFVKKYHEK